MNNKGWSLNELLVGLGALTFCLVLVIILFQSHFEDTKDDMKESLMMYTYESIEADMVTYAEVYVKEEYGKHMPSEDMKITITDLRKETGFSKYKDPKDGAIVCKGYVLVKPENGDVTYKPYVKCGKNYETKGYKE